MQNLTFRNRRYVALAATLLAILIVAAIAKVQTNRLGNPAIFTGATVLGSIVLLCLLGVRRRLPVIPLGTVATWTQIHLYTGIFAAVVYFMHVPAIIGDGVFESGLSIVFLLVTASGFYGIYASRTLPKRLTTIEGEHRFDRVAWHRGQIADNARLLIDEIEEQAATRVLGNFYANHLQSFFGSRPSLAYVLVPTGHRRRRLLSGLQDLDRYLEVETRSTAGRFAALVRRRDDLDYQYALQLRLRLWLVMHSFFSVALLVGGIVHAVIALKFMA